MLPRHHILRTELFDDENYKLASEMLIFKINNIHDNHTITHYAWNAYSESALEILVLPAE